MANGPTSGQAQSASRQSRLAEVARLAAIDPPGAARLAVRAKAEGVTDALVHHLVALQLKDQGRFEDAVAELGLGLAIEPENPRLMTEVGFCLLELGRRREAAQVLGVAVKLDPGSADTNFAYGWAAEKLGALAPAETAFKRAVSINPGHAHALAGLSGLAVRRREWDAARSYAERAAAIDPRQTDALMNLARIDIGVGDFEAAAQRLARIVDLPYLKPLARIDVRIMTGDALDGAGRYHEAYAAYAEAKSELRDYYAAAYEGPGVKTAVDGVRNILRQFQAAPPAAWAKPPIPPSEAGERGHVFLVGFPRSGTTLLEQVLASHPDVVALEERPVLIDAEVEFLTEPGGVTRLAQTPGEALAPFRTRYWQRVREFDVEPRGKVFVDKHPLSTLRLPLISKVFPGAKILFALRDPRDVVLSCLRRNFNMSAAMYEFNSLERAAGFYDAMMRAAQVYLAELPFEVHRLRYEDLVADFDGTARGVCDFLGVPWNTQMRDFAATAASRRIATPSSTQVGRGLYGEGVGQWRNYAFALEPVLPVLRPWIEKFGYDPD